MTTGQFRPLRRIDVDREVGAIRRVMSDNPTGLVYRHLMVGLAALAMWIATGRMVLLAWALGYVLLHLIYVRLLRRFAPPHRTRHYLALMVVHVLTALWVTGMIWYVLTWGGAAAIFVAACGICGLALYALSNHDRWSHVAVVDVGNVVLATFGMIAMLGTLDLGPAETLAIGVIGLGQVIYFLHAASDVIETRARLAARHAAEAQAEKMQAIGQLGAGIAHDFNNILTVIRGNLDLIDVVEDTPERAAVLDEARKGTDRAAHLVRQLLAYSRKSPLSVTRFDLQDFLAETAEVLHRVLPETVRVRLLPARDEVILAADRSLLATAILNAALNARDAMGPGGGELTLAARPTGDMVAVILRDTGPGVPPELLPRIAEPFFSTRPAGQGSGLGLSMIKGFAEQSGGELHLENLRGGGFGVEIRLPAEAGAETGCPALSEGPARTPRRVALQ